MITPILSDPTLGVVDILDQRRLPHEKVWLSARSCDEVAEAIRDMAVRGAPAIAIAAAYGLALALQRHEGPPEELQASFDRARCLLAASRPTAVNLFAALHRVSAALEDCLGTGRVEEARDRAWTEARRIQEEDLASCRAIGVCGARHLRDGGSYLTHCNTGALATGGHGTALGVFRTASAQGKRLHVWVDETRPYLQGARLTAWELAEESIPATLVCDAAAASLMASGRVEAVLVGADRITRRGWVANKLGTYGLAVLARHHGVPFFVAAPLTSFDASLDEGRDIPIEERNPLEVLSVAGTLVAPRGFPAFNPAFDLTPPELVSAFFTDQGELLPPYGATIPARLMEQAR